MLENMKMMGALAGLMKNKEGLQEASRRVREKMESTRVTGEAGGGAAIAVVTGSMRVVSVELSPALVTGMAGDPKTHELAAGLIADAVNSALGRAQQRLQEAVRVEARALGLEGMLPELSKMMGA
ncbi:Nucleoid-associated protein [Phycisphaerales bacterium]|nr:Nucleoid-associated protein [Phycisphaerales bacterium]